MDKKLYTEIESILEVNNLVYLLDDGYTVAEDIDEILSELDSLMDDEEDEDNLEAYRSTYVDLQCAERNYCDEVNSINK